MTLAGWLQIVFVFAIVIAAAWPLGILMARLFGRSELLPAEGTLYRIAGIDPKHEQSWAAYALGMLIFNFIGFVVLYLLQRLQFYLPLQPAGLCRHASRDLAFNTGVSFVTNTNWQSYGGETTLSHFSQMAGLTVQNFLSAATGIALAMALTRAFARSKRRRRSAISGSMSPGRPFTCCCRSRSSWRFELRRAGHAADARWAVRRPRSKAPSRRSRSARWPARKPSSSSAPMAAASSTSTPRIPSKTQRMGSNYLNIFAMLVVSAALVMFGQPRRRHAPGLGAAHRHDGDAYRRRRRRLLGGSLGQSDPAALGVDSPAAIWKARKCASARR
jgi:K+-transporting ATPase ATPase A chain